MIKQMLKIGEFNPNSLGLACSVKFTHAHIQVYNSINTTYNIVSLPRKGSYLTIMTNWQFDDTFNGWVCIPRRQKTRCKVNRREETCTNSMNYDSYNRSFLNYILIWKMV